jgi:hypothetical protein
MNLTTTVTLDVCRVAVYAARISGTRTRGRIFIGLVGWREPSAFLLVGRGHCAKRGCVVAL